MSRSPLSSCRSANVIKRRPLHTSIPPPEGNFKRRPWFKADISARLEWTVNTKELDQWIGASVSDSESMSMFVGNWGIRGIRGILQPPSFRFSAHHRHIGNSLPSQERAHGWAWLLIALIA